RQDPGSAYAAAIPLFISKYLRRERPIVYDDGRQSRDFTHVANVVEANLRAAGVERLRGESVNVAAGQPRSVLELLEAIAEIFGYRMEPEFRPARPGDIRNSHADITLALGRLERPTTLRVVPSLGREISPFDDLRALGALAAVAREFRPDIVHTHLAKAGTLGRIAGRLAGPRALVHTYHGTIFQGY